MEVEAMSSSTLHVHITSEFLDKFEPPEDGVLYLRDTEQTGFGVQITKKNTVTFMHVGRFEGRTRRFMVEGGYYRNTHGNRLMTVTEGRKAAKRIKTQLKEGKNPAEHKSKGPRTGEFQKYNDRDKRIANLTLRKVIEDYIHFKEQSVELKESSAYCYRSHVPRCFKDYMDRPFADITEQVILDAITEQGKKITTALRHLQAYFTFARRYRFGSERLFTDNPAKRLRDEGLWTGYKVRGNALMPKDLAQLFNVLDGLVNPIDREYALFLLFTGCRSGELRKKLTWDKIDFKSGYFRLDNTKNSKTVELPLPEYIARTLLLRRNDSGKKGHVFVGISSEGRSVMNALEKQFGYRIIFHDLRRTFASFASGLGIDERTIKILMNHTVPSQSVTDKYINYAVAAAVSELAEDNLKIASERVVNTMLKYADRPPAPALVRVK